MVTKFLPEVNETPLYKEFHEVWRDDLKRSGLTPEQFPSSVVPPAEDGKGRTSIWRANIPFYSPEGRQLEGVWRERVLERHPTKYYSPSKKTKALQVDRTLICYPYLYPKGCNWPIVFDDTSIDLILTEGEKASASVLANIELPCIGTSGVDSVWAQDVAQPIDFDRPKVLQKILRDINWSGRNVTLLVDADGREGRGVQMSMRALGEVLTRKGAIVKCFCADPLKEDDKAGIDDWIGFWLEQGLDPQAEYRRALRTWFEMDLTVDPLIDMFRGNYHIRYSDKNRIAALEYNEHGYLEYNMMAPQEAIQLSVPMLKVGEGQPVKAMSLWYKHEQRPVFRSSSFFPYKPDEHGAKLKEGVFNLQPPWPISPRKGGCPLFFKYAREVLCDGDEVKYDYFIKLLAHGFQYPHLLAEVALILYSPEEGTGKTTLYTTWLGPMYGANAVCVQDSDKLTGTFNSSIEGKLLIFGDELMWPGNPKANKRLLSLITDQNQQTERKGLEHKNVNHCGNVMWTTNDEKVVNMGNHDRRYFPMRVSAREMQNRTYFAALANEAKSGGREALLHHLLYEVEVDAKLGALPATEERKQQAMMSLKPLDRYFLWLLQGGKAYLDGTTFEWSGRLNKKLLKDGYKYWLTQESLLSRAAAAAEWQAVEADTNPAFMQGLSAKLSNRVKPGRNSKSGERWFTVPVREEALKLFGGF